MFLYIYIKIFLQVVYIFFKINVKKDLTLYSKRIMFNTDQTKGRNMIINHTSPNIINKINANHEYFKGALFFSSDIYTMTQSKEVHHYTLELNEDQIIHVSDLDPSQEMIDQVKWDFQCLFDIEIDDDQAIELLTEEDEQDTIEEILEENETSLYELGYELASEFSWMNQGNQSLTARQMGFIACESTDEQGTVYMINLVDREDLLKYEGNI